MQGPASPPSPFPSHGGFPPIGEPWAPIFTPSRLVDPGMPGPLQRSPPRGFSLPRKSRNGGDNLMGWVFHGGERGKPLKVSKYSNLVAPGYPNLTGPIPGFAGFWPGPAGTFLKKRYQDSKELG
ncbi:uncharacterized protein LOC125033251 [Penaeus chinensis]|uniref:uncharacterized protein LOC125033251 n=1 Tax=Penaeus chinensis TaxID=139456 RepID=UPI001FB84F49|nr:uncharacterized protein LOC125033251 [Penaeus chinensis]